MPARPGPAPPSPAVPREIPGSAEASSAPKEPPVHEPPVHEPVHEPVAESQPSVAAPTRRIVAVLVTYTWTPEGEIHPVREGRNVLGSDPGCDISVPGDGHLSSRHATLLVRGRHVWIDDEKSMNGTFVDGESVEEKQRLEGGARVQTGATEWSFQRLDESANES